MRTNKKAYTLNHFNGEYRDIMGIFSSFQSAVDAFVKNVEINDEKTISQYSNDFVTNGEVRYGEEVWWVDVWEMDKYECIND